MLGNMKKIAVLMLAAATVSGMLASCARGSENSEASETSGDVSSAAETTLSEVTREPLEIPEGVDYDGYEFKILTYSPSDIEESHIIIRNFSPVEAEAENGEAINDAVFTRNRMTEEQLGIKITPLKAVSKEMTKTIVKDVQAGMTEYDAAFQMIRAAQNTGMQGHLIRIDEIDTVCLDKPWWDKAIQEGAAINNALYVITGDATIEDKEGMSVMYYNDKLAADNALSDIFGVINDGSWTFDEAWSRMKAVAKDANGDGAIDHNDVVGTGTNFSSLVFFLNAFNTGYAHLENGVPVSSLDSERTVNIIRKMGQFLNDSTTVLIADRTEGGWTSILNMFKDDRMLIYSSCYYKAAELRDMESEFTIIPWPKYDEAQENYRAATSPHASYGFVVPVTCSDPERVGVIMETMSYHSTDTVLNAYVNITLEGKVARNDESVEMMHRIIGSAYYDIGYVYDWAGINKVVYDSVKTPETNFVSAYAAVRDSYLKQMENTYNMYS